MKKLKKQQPFKLSYKQRYKNQANTIKELLNVLDGRETNIKLLSVQIDELKRKCKSLELDLRMSNNVKEMYFSAINAQLELEDANNAKKPWWKRVF